MRKSFLLVFIYLLFMFFFIDNLNGQQNSNLIENFSIDQSQNIMQPGNFGIINGKITVGIQYSDLTSINGIWAPPYVSSDFSLQASINGSPINCSQYVWKPFNVERTAIVNGSISANCKTLLIPDKRTGVLALTLNNQTTQTVLIPVSLKIKGTLNCLNSDDSWGFGTSSSSITTNVNPMLDIDQSFVFDGFTTSDHLFAAIGDTVYWQCGNQLRRGSVSNGALLIDQSYAFNGFSTSDNLFAMSGGYVYWQSGKQLRRGSISNGILTIDQSFVFNGFTTSDHLFAASGNIVYWQCGNQLRRGCVSNGALLIDQSFVFNEFLASDHLFAAAGDTVCWQSENYVKRGVISNGVLSVDQSFTFGSFSSRDKLFNVSGNTVYWQNANQLRCGIINSSMIKLEQGNQSIFVSANNLIWNSSEHAFTGALSIQALNKAELYIVFSIGASSDALTECTTVANNPENSIINAQSGFNNNVIALYQNIPQFSSNNIQLKHFYDRSLISFLQNKWNVPEFNLNPYYSTGSIKGGCVGEYLWNFGEAMEIMSLYDPLATKAHIKQFLRTGVQKGFGFLPVNGSMLEPNYFYPINQEKIIGLTYHYVKNSGDVGFLSELIGSGTVLDAIISQALFCDDVSKPVSLIDYNICDPQHLGGKSHLELQSETYIYRYKMPDLNGRRYLNYEYAAKLSELAGKPRNDLMQRAQSLKNILRTELWDSTNNWFKFEDTRTNTKDNRYTVQMFYLLNSDVLDEGQKNGLLSHLNENEFLSAYGLHSLAKGDLAYDLNDIDNGGPGICTSFPLNIAQKLYLCGNAKKAEDILSRILWWGEKMPYWGDSFYADRMDYRKNTPLQSTIDGVSGVQCIIFGMFGVCSEFDGSIKINPNPPSFATQISLKGVKLLNHTFDIAVNGSTYKVIYNNDSLTANIGQSIMIKNYSLVIENNLKTFLNSYLNINQAFKGQYGSTVNYVHIFPNPADNFLFIQFDKDVEFIKNIILYNVDGQVVLKTGSFENIGVVKQINVSNLRSGVYFINIYIDDQVVHEKILIK